MVPQIQIGRQAGEVRQQFAHGDLSFSVLRKIGQIYGNRIVDMDAALVDKLHHCGSGCDHLGQRS